MILYYAAFTAIPQPGTKALPLLAETETEMHVIDAAHQTRTGWNVEARCESWQARRVLATSRGIADGMHGRLVFFAVPHVEDSTTGQRHIP